jgi:hypothetical protein
MINIWTSHNEIFNVDRVVVDIIAEYQTTGQVNINMNREGPSCEAIGLYRILDNICKKFKFDKSKFLITTWNAEELHPTYKIRLIEQRWIAYAKKSSANFNKEGFVNKKNFKNLFGCMYNIPSWNRLCLLAYIKQHTTHSSILAVNGTWEAHNHNTFYLNQIVDFCPTEFFNIVELIKSDIGPLPGHPGHKPTADENMQILNFYNDFFVDVVAETYTNGLTFFLTEKTIRPILGLTPFITFGPQGFLANLRSRYGIKTFGQWWDESYDDYQAYDRIKGMYKVIDYLDSLTTDEHIQMYREMQDVLDYNYEIIKNL